MCIELNIFPRQRRFEFVGRLKKFFLFVFLERRSLVLFFFLWMTKSLIVLMNKFLELVY